MNQDDRLLQWYFYAFLPTRKASDQGHPHAAYNLAVGHLKGMKTDLKPGLVTPIKYYACLLNMYLLFSKNWLVCFVFVC